MTIKNPEKESILIVDDSPQELESLSDCFRMSGFKILVAENGEIALDMVKYAQPDIVLLDVRMRGLDGFETCRRLKANSSTQDIPVIFMTALHETTDKIRGLQLGAVDYITKPIQYKEVLARINTHLTIRRLTKRLHEQNEYLQQEICERKQAEEQMLRLQAELREALAQEKELSELKSRIISTISHEYRTPLTTIASSAAILQTYDHKLDEAKKLKHLERIQNCVTQMTNLVSDVLFLSRAEFKKLEFQPEALDLVSFIKELVDDLKIGISDTHQVTFTTMSESIPFYGDSKMLWQLLTQLLSNAINYSPNGGSISIQVTCEDEQVRLQVSDEGIGISLKDQETLFEAFNRGKNVGTIAGTGLGLSIVKKCVEHHGGQIAVESVVGTGTTFIVSLPLSTKVLTHPTTKERGISGC